MQFVVIAHYRARKGGRPTPHFGGISWHVLPGIEDRIRPDLVPL
jgi:hypothetical protein